MDAVSTSSREVYSHSEIPSSFEGIGYLRSKDSLPLESFSMPVPRPEADQVLILVYYSSINPLEYKLARLNFLGRIPPVVLGFDIAGVVVAVGDNVDGFIVGDEVMAMADCTGNGGWAAGGKGGYAVARDYLTVKKPASVEFRSAGTLPMCFLAAYLGLQPYLEKGDTVYIPGGGGGVGHLAVQMAARTLGAAKVISSGSSAASRDLARSSGAGWVFDYQVDNVASEVMALTDGKGADIVYDATYSETGFVETAKLVREGGRWVVLGVGPGRTTRTSETVSPVGSILAARSALQINVNLLRYFVEPDLMNEQAKSLFRNGMLYAAQWAGDGSVVPHVSRTLAGDTKEITEQLTSIAQGVGSLGKVAVRLSPDSSATVLKI